jgi:predicted ATPase/class 3 adenylate cyclase
MGVVTLVVTDVEASVKLWERHADAMREAMRTHDAVLRDAASRAGGYEVRRDDDSFLFAFAVPLQAVFFCLEAQQDLLKARWPEALGGTEHAREITRAGNPLFRGLRVRMGVHLGAADARPNPKTGRMDYTGRVLKRARRVAGAGHGGQVLVTQAAWREVESQQYRLDEPVVVDLGEHRLKDLEEPEHIYQVTPHALAGRTFPPLRAFAMRSSHVPAHPTRFVGRVDDLVHLSELLDDDTRLITVAGTGGIGKTRLALRFAEQMAEQPHRWPGGVWFVDLTEARSVYGMCNNVGEVFEVPLSTRDEDETVALLGRAIASRGRALVVLDNFEQCAPLAPRTLGRWLQVARDASFVVTTRAILHLPGETVVELDPLTVPAGKELDDSEAVELFLDRAHMVDATFEVEPEEQAAVGEIVRQLDGIPLAIELAASRMKVLTPRQLLDRIGKRFEVLRRQGEGDARQRTLQGAIDWSWNLLDEDERAALAQCSVFTGGFTLESAEAVLDLGEESAAPSVLDVVERLRDRSLLRTESRRRFSLFVSIREYAYARLVERGAAEDALARHAEHYLAVGARLADQTDGPDGGRRLRELTTEAENLVAVLQRALDRPLDDEGATRTAVNAMLALEPHFNARGALGVHRDLLDATIARLPEEGSSAEHARVVASRARTMAALGHMAEALLDQKRALAIARRAKDPRTEGRIEAGLGQLLFDLGRDDKARERYESALGQLDRARDERFRGRVLRDLGVLFSLRGRRTRARELLLEALRVHRKTKDARFEGVTLGNLAAVHHDQGRLEEALAACQSALEVVRDFGDRRMEAAMLPSLGALVQEQGDLTDARRAFERALAIAREVGDRRAEGIALGYLGGNAQEESDDDEALRLYKASLAIHREVDNRRSEALVLARLGGLEAQLGQLDAAEDMLDAAELLLEGMVEAYLLEALSLHRGHLELARARVAERTGDDEGAQQLRKAASRRIAELMASGRRRAATTVTISGNARLLDRAAPGGTQSVGIQSDEVRFAVRMLERALDRLETAQDGSDQ